MGTVTRPLSGRQIVVASHNEGKLREFAELMEPFGFAARSAAELGLLPGVLRRKLIVEGRAVEAELTLDDLADGFFIGNATRGLLAAVLQP